MEGKRDNTKATITTFKCTCTIVLKKSWLWKNMELKLKMKHFQRKVISWLFYNPPFPSIIIQPFWPEAPFQWADRAGNQTGITLLSHSGFTRFTYNSLLIVLDHQLILCSQEGFIHERPCLCCGLLLPSSGKMAFYTLIKRGCLVFIYVSLVMT